jgi:hypothetical protein
MGSAFSGVFNRPERAASLAKFFAKGYTKVFSEAPASISLQFTLVRGKLILEVRIRILRILGSFSADLVPYRT